MESLTYILQNLPWFIILIGALVFFHELGHFLVAKAFDVKVLKFSLGFGPKLFGYRRGETEYVVSALPLGGFVKMVGDMPGSDVDDEDAPRALSSKPLWQRSLVLVAGPAFNFLLAFMIYLVMMTGMQTFQSTKLGIVNPGEPAWEAGIRPGDEILAINGVATPTWRELRELVGSRPGEKLRITYKRDGMEKTVTLEPNPRQETNIFQEKETRGKIGVSLYYVKPVVAVVDSRSPAAVAGIQGGDVITKVNGNPVDAWHELKAALAAVPEGESVQLELERAVETERPSEVSDEADVAEPETNTLVLRMEPVLFDPPGDASDEEPAASTETAQVAPVGAPQGIDRNLFSAADTGWGYTGLVSRETTVVEVEEGTPAEEVGMRSGDRLLEIEVRKKEESYTRPVGVAAVDLNAMNGVDAQSDFVIVFQRDREILRREFRMQRREDKDEFKNARTRYVFGAMTDRYALGMYTFEREVGLGEAIWRAAIRVGEDTTLIARGLAKMASGSVPMDQVAGPIGLFYIAGKTVEYGWEVFMRTMAVISVNLGLLNLLPIPVLDGGHLMFFAIEAVRRRPPSERFREVAHMVGLALLLLLMVWVIRNDILRYVLG